MESARAEIMARGRDGKGEGVKETVRW